MEITKLWQPYNMKIHKQVKLVVHNKEKDKLIILLHARNSKGEILNEHKLNNGEIIEEQTIIIDFSIFKKEMKQAVQGLVEVVFVCDKPFTKDIGCYYLGKKGFSYVTNNPLPRINASNRLGKYRGFSVHLVESNIKKSGIAIMNVSIDNNYAKKNNYSYEIRTTSGELIKKESMTIEPFGTLWVEADTNELIKTNQNMYTIFGKSDDSALISFLYFYLEDGSMGIDHTAPPFAQQLYGANIMTGLKSVYSALRNKIEKKARYQFNYFEKEDLTSIRSLFKRIKNKIA